MGPDKPSVQLAAGRLAYLEEGSGPAVVLIHGIPTSSALWHDVIPLLARHFHVYAVDMLGYGDSDKPEHADLSVAAQAEYLRQFLGYLGIERATLVGHDIGGGVAQLCTVRSPQTVHRLVLVDSIVYDSWPVPDIDRLKEPSWDETFERLDLSRGFRRAFQRGLVHQDKVTDELVDRYVRPFADRDGRFAYLRAARALNGLDLMQMIGDIERIAVPTLIVWGQQDDYQPLANGERLTARLPNARLAVISDGGHFLPEDAPDQLATLILEFLQAE